MAIEVPMLFDDCPLVWTVDGVLSQSECLPLIHRIERSRPETASNNPGFRDQDRVIWDDFDFASLIFTRLSPHLPRKIGELKLSRLNERFRMYRYRLGQKFTPHTDHWYEPNSHEISLLSVLVYLNSNFQGGETRFMEQIDKVIKPKDGLAAIFQHKVRHEGCQVNHGTKYAFRTDVIYKT